MPHQRSKRQQSKRKNEPANARSVKTVQSTESAQPLRRRCACLCVAVCQCNAAMSSLGSISPTRHIHSKRRQSISQNDADNKSETTDTESATTDTESATADTESATAARPRRRRQLRNIAAKFCLENVPAESKRKSKRKATPYKRG